MAVHRGDVGQHRVAADDHAAGVVDLVEGRPLAAQEPVGQRGWGIFT